MAKITTNITSATTTEITTARKSRDVPYYFATIFVTGTFGGTTVTLQASPDGGTTKVTLNDPLTGTAYSLTANGAIDIKLGAGGTNSDQIRLYAVTTGGAGININANVFDNF